MASELRDLIQGAAVQKAMRFADEDFAGGYGGAVVNRVKRRRAMSAVGIGGASAVGVGALAIGAANLQSNTFGPGIALSDSSTVVCTTSPATPPSQSADNSLTALGMPSPQGIAIWGVAIGSQDPPNIVATIAIDTNTHEVTAAESGGTSVALTPDADGVYALQFSDGNRLTFIAPNDNLLLKSTTLEPVGEPVVTCVTMTPEASASATTSTSAPASASPSVTPSPTISEVAGAVDSPFYCGAKVPEEEHGDYDFNISQVSWESPEAVNTMVDHVVELIGEDYWNDAKGADVLKVTLYTKRQPSVGGLSGAGATSPLDPRDLLDVGFIDTTGDGAAFSRGLGFVAVRDGVVVGVLPGDNQNADGRVYEDGNDPNPSAYLLTPDGAFEACPGVELGDDWDLYAIGGQVYAYSDGTAEPPVFAWKKIEPRG